MFAVGDKVRSRFGIEYEVVEITADKKYKCKRLADGAIIKLSEDKILKAEKE